MIDKTVADAAAEVTAALDKLMLAEMATADVARYGRIGQLTQIAKTIRQRYATRVGDVAKTGRDDGGFQPLHGGIIQGGDDGAEYLQMGDYQAVMPRLHDNGLGDMSEILREAMMNLQKVQDDKSKPRPRNNEEVLEDLLGVHAQLTKAGLTTEADKLMPRIKELVALSSVEPLPLSAVDKKLLSTGSHIAATVGSGG